MSLDGAVAIVTGAASGIGLAIARRLSAEGARVVMADIDRGAVELAAAGIRAAEGVALDVTDEAGMEALVAGVVAHCGRLDIMVNNAGIIEIGPVAQTDPAAWRRLMAVNLDGTFLGCRAAARVMTAQVRAGGPAGRIVNMASGAGRRGVPLIAGYCASKAAVISLTQSLAQELGPLGIRVNAVTPGHVETPFWDGIAAGFARATDATPEAVVDRFRASVPMGRFGRPEEVAAAVAWLCGPEASYVSGEALAVNGAELPW